MVYFPEELWNIIKNYQFEEYWLKKYQTVLTDIPKATISRYLSWKSFPLSQDCDIIKKYYQTKFVKDNYHGHNMIIEYQLLKFK